MTLLSVRSWFRAGRRLPLIAGALALLAGAAPAARAQTATANVRGYVRTAAGAPVADAQVSARNLDNNATRTTTTTDAGFYYVGGLRPGRYEIIVRRVGFGPQTRAVQLPIGQTLDLNVVIGEAAVQLSAVQVRASNELADTRTSEVGTNISQEQLDALPNFERNFLDIAALVPGVTPKQVNDGNKFLAAGGQPAEAVNVFVDGATYKNDVLRGGVVGQDASKGNPFPQGAVQEFRVITQNYKAEYQKASSAIITATTRSGTNQLELEGFAYGIGNQWVARDAFTIRQAGARPNYDRLQAGLSLGAPIVKDRLFFFGTYELNFRDEPQNVFLGGAANSAPAALVSQLQTQTGQFASEFRQHLGFGKLTWNASDRSTVDASLTVRSETDFRGFGGQTAFGAAENVDIGVYTGVANWKYAGDRWLNELQVNAQSFDWNPKPRDPNVVGRNYEGLLRVGGRDTRQLFTQSRLSIRDDVTRAGVRFAGDHVFKGGASVDFLNYEAEKFFTSNPVYTYTGANDYATPVRANFGFGDPSIDASNVQLGAYLQDDWAVTPKLMLNLGVRWDVETNGINNSYATPQALADSLRGPLAGQFFVDQPLPDGTTRRRNIVGELGGLDNYITRGRDDRPTFLGAIQPRLGASYDFFGNGRTVVFGGFGIYYDRNYWNTLLDEQFRRQFSVLQVNFAPDCSVAGAPPGCAVWDDRYLDPAQLRTLAGTAGLPEVFLVKNDMEPPRTQHTSLGVRQMLGSTQFTVSYNGIRGTNGMNFVRATPWGGLGPNYSTAFVVDDRVKTWYDALTLQVQRPLLDGGWWGGSLAYTFARSEEQGQSQDIFWPFTEQFPTVAELPRRRAPGDQRHSIVTNAILRLPYEIRFSALATLGTGIASNATDASRGWGPFEQQQYVFTPPTRAFLGLGNVFATQNVDLRAEKTFPVVGRQDVTLVLDAFNVFNSRNFGCFDATIFPTAGDPNANFGRPGCAGLGRRLQLGVRYGFRGAERVN